MLAVDYMWWEKEKKTQHCPCPKSHDLVDEILYYLWGHKEQLSTSHLKLETIEGVYLVFDGGSLV